MSTAGDYVRKAQQPKERPLTLKVSSKVKPILLKWQIEEKDGNGETHRKTLGEVAEDLLAFGDEHLELLKAETAQKQDSSSTIPTDQMKS